MDELVSSKKWRNVMKNILLSLQFLFVLVLVACSSGQEPDDVVIPTVRQLTPSEQQVATASNNFSLEILQEINQNYEQENIFISPFSISTALSMVVNGAEGETNEGIKVALGLDGVSDEEINESYKSLVSYLYSLDPTVTLNVANSTWYRNDLTINSEFEAILNEYYNATINAADFTDAGTVDLINNWIENQTNDKIKDMLNEIPPEAIMYLINAVYFKAEWTSQFDKDRTEDGQFTLADESTVMTETMFGEDVKYWSYYDAENNYSFIELPYGIENYGFAIIMPDEPGDINTLLQEFTVADLTNAASQSFENQLNVLMPKFKISFKELLNEYLISMGMGKSFQGDAEFTKLIDEDIRLFISMVLHQSFLEVNEEGSEAAAATVIGIETTSTKPRQLVIDKPFIFFIRERNSNTILFEGKLMDPTQ